MSVLINSKVYRTVIIRVLSYDVDTWSLIMWRLIVFENLVLKKVFGPKREEVTECWRKLHNEDPALFVMLTNCLSGELTK
jgi:hypothetical protein